MISQPPVIHRAGFTMRILDIQFSNADVVSDHIERGMTQQSLKGKDIATGSQICRRKGVPELVRVRS